MGSSVAIYPHLDEGTTGGHSHCFCAVDVDGSVAVDDVAAAVVVDGVAFDFASFVAAAVAAVSCPSEIALMFWIRPVVRCNTATFLVVLTEGNDLMVHEGADTLQFYTFQTTRH